jgi:hypothetical protein
MQVVAKNSVQAPSRPSRQEGTSGDAKGAQPIVERVFLRRLSAIFGFADMRLPGVHLRGLRVQQRGDGTLTIRPPERQDDQGRTWSAFALQPDTREAVETEIAVLWARGA